MDNQRRQFLDELLETATPSGFETAGQRLWIEYVEEFVDEVRTDEYGNAVAVVEGGEPSVALTGHGDEIGFMVRDIEDDGMLRMTAIGGSDRTVSKGQHVRVHTSDGVVPGVVGQAAIHLRDADDESIDDIDEQHVDIGAADADEAAELVERGDPITFDQTVSELANDRIAARGLDNRIGIWAAAEALRRATARDLEATIYAVSTVQEEVGLQGAKMVGFDLDPDAVVAVDVTHATDAPGTPSARKTGVELGAGPVVVRGSANHPRLVDAIRDVADAADIDVQLQASGNRTGTDADAFYTSRGGIPSANIGVPNRYMHTPVEVLDLDDLDAVADLLAEFAAVAHEHEFSVNVR
ncbi:M20/M25/M40 family metallo-hydrolase [Natronorubrum aibiense]|uniref:M20/M25/M40 family metallo-hydrolase n=1 Tax=Natronorubrum aibiense TaxID=348826 RepID=A0A5P9P443_9EURY|nr:M20/M25/M40 family metallo-hydrolase [Natronorubrum aibiense]QFU82914.1 M20/M25/M40 family metallo-hydrolase [Natronorubrum aibiense]